MRDGGPTSHRVSRRRALQTGVAGLALASSISEAQSKPAKRPNILLLMDDQHRADCLGAVGHPCVQTPNLDRLATEGALFRNAYCSTPSCIPARAGLLTGLSPWHHGMLGYGRVAVRYENEMPRLLREAGYHTTGVGKMHWHPQRNLHGFHQTILDESGRVESPDFVSDYRKWFHEQSPTLDPDATGIGWNDYQSAPYALPERLHPTRWIADTAVDFLRTYERDEAWFLKVSFERPHSPYDPPARFFDRYKDAKIPQASIGDWADRNAMRGTKLPADTWRGDLGAEQVRRSRQGYYGSISFVDEQAGRVLDELRRRNWLDDTLIIYLSDHGDMVGDHHLWRKSYAYEGSAKIPMIIRWPQRLLDARRRQILDNVVELRDVLPTFLDAAGVKFDRAKFDGRSMLDCIRGTAADWRSFIDLEHDVCYSPENHWSALTDGQTKYIFHAQHGTQQLFDLRNDPHELKDLSTDAAHADMLKIWRRRLVDHLRERGEPFVVNDDLGIRPKSMLYGPAYPRV